MQNDAALLAGVPFFQPLKEEERAALAATIDVERFPDGQVIFEYGDPGDAMYIIRQGAIEISIRDDTGHRIVLNTAQPGDFIGEISLLDNGPRTASARSVGATEVLRVDRGDLEEFLQYHPGAAMELLTVVGHRLRDTNQRLRHTASRNVNEQVAADTRTVVQRAVDWIADFSGSIPFLMINAALFLIWILINTGLVPGIPAFDPFPFNFLTMSVSLEAIFLSTFVLISQNRQAAKDRVRSDIEYDVNLKAELEIAHLHEKLDYLNTQLQTRLDAIQRALTGAPAIKATGSLQPGVERAGTGRRE